jgi:hypothetical protein
MVHFVVLELLIYIGLFAAILAAQEFGRWSRQRALGSSHPQHKPESGATEAAVFGLLGLLLAFTFSGAGARFDARREMILEEANAIGTAWLRIDLLPQASQQPIRDLFRKYVDERLATYRSVGNAADVQTALKRTSLLQQAIWKSAVAAAEEGHEAPQFTVVLPAVNDMLDIAAKRVAAAQLHPPMIIYLMIGLLALCGAVFVGYGQAEMKVRGPFYALAFAAVVSTAVFVTIELEFPRLGFVRIDAADQILVAVRAGM